MLPADPYSKTMSIGHASTWLRPVLLGNARRGLWSLTTEGHEKRLSQEEIWDLYVRIRDANRPSGSQAEEDVPAPGTEGDNEEGKSYWFGVNLISIC
jgi:hypothetical protein